MQSRDYNLPPWVSEECKDLVHSMLAPGEPQEPALWCSLPAQG